MTPRGFSFTTPFPAARYRLHGIVERDFDFLHFAGSALRGAFGHALRRAACVTGAANCKPCPLYRSCTYPAIFETPPPLNAQRVYSQVPNPYVIEPPAPGPVQRSRGDHFDFGLVLIGPAIGKLPLLTAAWRSALGSVGTGSVRLQRVDAEGDNNICIPGPPPHLASGISLVFSTPLNLSRNGRDLAPNELTAHALLMSLVRRTATYVEMHLGQTLDVDFPELDRLAGGVTMRGALQPASWQRHSSRQQRRMTIGGTIGTVTLSGDLCPFWPFLYLGQWLHVGKKCTLGFGRYNLSF